MPEWGLSPRNIQRQQGVDDQLAWAMVGYISTPVYPVDLHPALAELLPHPTASFLDGLPCQKCRYEGAQAAAALEAGSHQQSRGHIYLAAPRHLDKTTSPNA
jgi:hypothetical protein